MIVRRPYELPPEKEALRQRAIKLEWITVAIVLANISALYLTMGGSRAMRTAWYEDMLSLIPPLSFLIATYFERRSPDREHPWGYFRTIDIAYLCASLALLMFGVLLVYGAVTALIESTHPSIGTTTFLGATFWNGWTMIAGLAFAGLGPVIIGRIKKPIAEELHDKVVRADADMNKADWMTSVSAIVGVLGIGYGLWWADSAAAIVISLSVLKDGISNLARVTRDLLDARPHTVSGNHPDQLEERVGERLRALPWVRDVHVRLREEGHVYTGEGFVTTQAGMSADELLAHQDEAERLVHDLDWRLYDFTLVPTRSLRKD